jgi:hypothetical protein
MGFNMEEVLLDGLGYTELPPAVQYFPSAIPTLSRYAKMMMARSKPAVFPCHRTNEIKDVCSYGINHSIINLALIPPLYTHGVLVSPEKLSRFSFKMRSAKVSSDGLLCLGRKLLQELREIQARDSHQRLG